MVGMTQEEGTKVRTTPLCPTVTAAKACAPHAHVLAAQMCGVFIVSSARICSGLCAAAWGREQRTAARPSSRFLPPVKNSGASRWADRRLPSPFGDSGSSSLRSARSAWLSSSGWCLAVPRWLLCLRHCLPHPSRQGEGQDSHRSTCWLRAYLAAPARAPAYISFARTVSHDQP